MSCSAPIALAWRACSWLTSKPNGRCWLPRQRTVKRLRRVQHAIHARLGKKKIADGLWSGRSSSGSGLCTIASRSWSRTDGRAHGGGGMNCTRNPRTKTHTARRTTTIRFACCRDCLCGRYDVTNVLYVLCRKRKKACGSGRCMTGILHSLC